MATSHLSHEEVHWVPVQTSHRQASTMVQNALGSSARTQGCGLFSGPWQERAWISRTGTDMWEAGLLTFKSPDSKNQLCPTWLWLLFMSVHSHDSLFYRPRWGKDSHFPGRRWQSHTFTGSLPPAPPHIPWNTVRPLLNLPLAHTEGEASVLTQHIWWLYHVERWQISILSPTREKWLHTFNRREFKL